MSRLSGVPVRAVVLTAVISCAGLAQANAPRPASTPVLAVRLASDKPAPGFSERRDVKGGDQPSVLFLSSKSVISDVDMLHARATAARNGLVVEIMLSNSAALHVRETTASNIGKYMAILADGRLAGSATIMSPVPRTNRLTVGLTLPAEAADSVRSLIEARWPERRR